MESSVDERVRDQVGEDGFISVARICGSQGRRGEVAAEIKTDFPERFTPGARFLLAKDPAAGEPREYVVENAWAHKGKIILKFAGVDSISSAEALTGFELLVAKSQRKELPAGNFFLDDLIGCRVMEDQREIGVVADWEDTGGAVLLHVRPAVKRASEIEILIPFAQEICTEIGIAERVIQVRLPEGLLDLNSAEAARKPARRVNREWDQ
jgi:16S rRNA processing protein RimM